VTATTAGALKNVVLDDEVYRQVQDLWARSCPHYGALRERYRGLPGLDGAHLPEGSPAWPEVGGRLTDQEKRLLDMTPSAESAKVARLSNKIRFTTVAYRRRGNYAKDDTAVKACFDNGGDTEVRYGLVQSIFKHALYPGGAEDIFVQCEWLDPYNGMIVNSNGIREVLRNRASVFNGEHRVIRLLDCAPYNVALLTQDPNDAGCSRFAVVDRAARVGDTY